MTVVTQITPLKPIYKKTNKADREGCARRKLSLGSLALGRRSHEIP